MKSSLHTALCMGRQGRQTNHKQLCCIAAKQTYIGLGNLGSNSVVASNLWAPMGERMFSFWSFPLQKEYLCVDNSAYHLMGTRIFNGGMSESISRK